MAYQKNNWRDYDETKTELQNMQNGAVVTPERLNHIENGIANSADKAEVTAQLAQKPDRGNISVTDIDKNLGKIDETYMSESFLSQMTGDTPIHAVPPREGIIRSHLANKSVGLQNMNFVTTSSNLLNDATVKRGVTLSQATGEEELNATAWVSDIIYVRKNTTYIKSSNVLRFHIYDDKLEQIRVTSNETITTGESEYFIRVVGTGTTFKLGQVNEGNVLLPHEEYTSTIPEEHGLVIKPTIDTVTRESLRTDSVDLHAMMVFKKPKNLFNKRDVIPNTSFSSANGSDIVSQGRSASKKIIKVEPLKTYTRTAGTSLVINYYDKKGDWIKNETIGTTLPSFTTPSWCRGVRVSVTNSSIENFMLTEGETEQPYEEYVFELQSTDEFPLRVSSNVSGVGGGTDFDSLKPFRKLNYVKQPYPELIASLSSSGCEVESLGFSADGVNQLYGISYGDVETKPVIFIVSAQHGSEWQAVNYGLDFMKRIAGTTEFYDSKRIALLQNTFAFYHIVCASPSGYINESYNTINNVNLNRNWDRNWETYNGEGIVTNNKGSSPFSEPETQIIRDKILALKPYMVLDCHTSGSLPGGIDTGKIYTDYREMLYGTYNEIFNIYNDADLLIQEWNVGWSPTLVGWAGLQTSKEGTKTISTIVEMNTNHGSNYGLTALFALSLAAYNQLKN